MNLIFFVIAAVILAAFMPTAQAGTVAVNQNELSTSSSTCGGNCPGGCASCPCGTSSSYQDISSWCSKHSWNQVSF